MIKNKLGTKFHSEHVHDETYIKTKVKEFDCKIKTNFLGNDVPKENICYTITIVSSNINEVIKTDLNSFIQKLHSHKKAQKRKQANKNRKFLLNKSKRKIDTYSLISAFVLLPECLYTI